MSTNFVHRKKLPPLFITKDLTVDELENLFTDREETIETLLHSINLFVEKGERRHILITGDRGVGKSTVLMKIKKDINEKWHDEIIPLFYMDWDFSHYGDIGDVLLEAAVGLSKKIDVSMEEKSNLLSIESKISSAESIFDQVPFDKKIILAVENFERYLKQSKQKKHEREKLRTFVENHENILVIGTSVQYPKKQLGNYNHPFFGFFETVIPMEPFDEIFFIQQVENLARYHGSVQLLNKEGKLKDKYVRKVKSIHLLTSGNPRYGVCLFGIFITEDPVEIFMIFDGILDTLTPYFEGIRDRLSDNEKLAFRLIANTTKPSIVEGTFSISSLTKAGNIDSDLLRSLLSKLKNKGFIEVKERKKRKVIYRVSHPLFAIWFMKTHIKGASEAGKPILEFAHAFYSMEDIEDVSKVKKLIKYKEDIGHGIAAKQLKHYYVSGALKYSTEFIEKGDYEKASSYLNKIDFDDIDSEKGKAVVYHEKGVLQGLRGKPNDALEEIDKALELDPKDFRAWYNKGNAFSDLGKHEDALVCYDKVLELDPEYVRAWGNKGNALLNLGKHEDALACYDKVLELDPKDFRAWYNKGNAFSDLGKHEDALACYDKVLELDPKNARSWGNKGNVLYDLGKHEDALACYDKTLELDPKDARAWYNKGTALINLGKFEDALACYDKALELDPKDASAWYNKGTALSDLGKFEDAVACYDKALELDPKHASAWYNKSTALSNLGRFEDAVACYDKSLEFDPKHINAWNNKGNTLFKLGKFEDALACYDKVLELDPEHAHAWSNKGTAFSQLGKHEDALVCYDKVLERDPKDAGAWNNKGNALSGLGKHKDALTAFDESEKLIQKEENVDSFLLLIVKINHVLAAVQRGNEAEIKDILKSVLEHSVIIDETTQKKVELLIIVYDSLLKHMPHIAVESIEHLKELENNLPENERFAASFEPISIAGKYLLEGDKALEGLSEITRKQVDMVLKRVEKKAKTEKSKPPKSKRKTRK